jgi:hypothetical protein
LPFIERDDFGYASASASASSSSCAIASGHAPRATSLPSPIRDMEP